VIHRLHLDPGLLEGSETPLDDEQPFVPSGGVFDGDGVVSASNMPTHPKPQERETGQKYVLSQVQNLPSECIQFLNHVNHYVDELRTLMVEKFQIIELPTAQNTPGNTKV
jgi:hypothetical protein